MAQLKSIGVPTNGDLERESLTSGDVVYVNSTLAQTAQTLKGTTEADQKLRLNITNTL